VSSGREAGLADLQGRAAIVVVWARWCGACLPELPYVQKLHERLKDRKDALVLSMNIDDVLKQVAALPES
jgi:thiol-disulfide isomerase/thioredoxin